MGDLLGDDVVSLLILEELVHLNDVRVVDFSEDADLIQKHSFIFFTHVCLSHNLNSPLSIGGLVQADSNFTEGTYIKMERLDKTGDHLNIFEARQGLVYVPDPTIFPIL